MRLIIGVIIGVLFCMALVKLGVVGDLGDKAKDLLNEESKSLTSDLKESYDNVKDQKN